MALEERESIPMPPAQPVQSRFRVVKLESKEPFRRGRWQCFDYLDEPTTNNETKTEEADDLNTTLTPTAPDDVKFALGGNETVPSVHLNYDMAAVPSDQGITPTPDGMNGDSSNGGFQTVLEDVSAARRTMENIQSHHIDGIPDEGAITAEDEGSPFGIEMKIEQCVDLVKMHLINTTHNELLEIRRRMEDLEKKCMSQTDEINSLKDSNHALQAQNEYYKRAFTAAVIAVQSTQRQNHQIQQQHQQQQQQQQLRKEQMQPPPPFTTEQIQHIVHEQLTKEAQQPNPQVPTPSQIQNFAHQHASLSLNDQNAQSQVFYAQSQTAQHQQQQQRMVYYNTQEQVKQQEAANLDANEGRFAFQPNIANDPNSQ